MDLVRGDHYFNVLIADWYDLVTAAVAHGWEPQGTGAPRSFGRSACPSGYFYNHGQYVYKSDAAAFAQALEAWLSSRRK
jgi:hypothetical protein